MLPKTFIKTILEDDGVVLIQVAWEDKQERHALAVQEFNDEFSNAKPPLYITRNNIVEFLKD